ncbi:MAG TPA: hypothetical protein VMM13_17610 [Euzebya sp.]|nr:hypothetical protein [Euzebya sp.]
MAATTIRTWLDGDRLTMHHAAADQIDGMDTVEFDGQTYCGRQGHLKLVHHENVDSGKLCPACLEVTGAAPHLEGTGLGPV